jgi:hypothetical protein
MIKILLIIKFLAFICSVAVAQPDIPVSFFHIDESSFNQGELKAKNIEKVICVMTVLNTTTLVHDTNHIYSIYYDKEYKPIYSKFISFKNSFQDSCLFTYSNTNVTTKKCYSDIFGKKDGRSKGIDRSICSYLYRNGKMVSFEEQVFHPSLNTYAVKHRDTILYKKDGVEQIIEYWQSPFDNTQMDSVIKVFRYDTTGNLITYMVSVSDTFNSKFHSLYTIYYRNHRKDYVYQETNTLGTPCTDNKSNTCYITRAKASEGFTIDLTCCGGQSLLSFELDDAEQKIAYKFDEIKRTLYMEGSKLPKTIYSISGGIIEIYNFYYK